MAFSNFDEYNQAFCDKENNKQKFACLNYFTNFTTFKAVMNAPYASDAEPVKDSDIILFKLLAGVFGNREVRVANKTEFLARLTAKWRDFRFKFVEMFQAATKGKKLSDLTKQINSTVSGEGDQDFEKLTESDLTQYINTGSSSSLTPSVISAIFSVIALPNLYERFIEMMEPLFSDASADYNLGDDYPQSENELARKAILGAFGYTYAKYKDDAVKALDANLKKHTDAEVLRYLQANPNQFKGAKGDKGEKGDAGTIAKNALFKDGTTRTGDLDLRLNGNKVDFNQNLNVKGVMWSDTNAAPYTDANRVTSIKDVRGMLTPVTNAVTATTAAITAARTRIQSTIAKIERREYERQNYDFGWHKLILEGKDSRDLPTDTGGVSKGIIKVTAYEINAPTYLTLVDNVKELAGVIELNQGKVRVVAGSHPAYAIYAQRFLKHFKVEYKNTGAVYTYYISAKSGQLDSNSAYRRYMASYAPEVGLTYSVSNERASIRTRPLDTAFHLEFVASFSSGLTLITPTFTPHKPTTLIEIHKANGKYETYYNPVYFNNTPSPVNTVPAIATTYIDYDCKIIPNKAVLKVSLVPYYTTNGASLFIYFKELGREKKTYTYTRAPNNQGGTPFKASFFNQAVDYHFVIEGKTGNRHTSANFEILIHPNGTQIAGTGYNYASSKNYELETSSTSGVRLFSSNSSADREIVLKPNAGTLTINDGFNLTMTLESLDIKEVRD